MATKSVMLYPQNTTDRQNTPPMVAFLADDETQKVYCLTEFDGSRNPIEMIDQVTPQDLQEYRLVPASANRSDLRELLYSGLTNYTHPMSDEYDHATLTEALRFFYPIFVRKG